MLKYRITKYALLMSCLLLVLSSCAHITSENKGSTNTLIEDLGIASNSIETDPATSAQPQLFEVLPEMDRLYLLDAELMSTYEYYTKLPLKGQTIAYDTMERLAADLEMADWVTFQTTLSNYNLEIDIQPVFNDPLYGLTFDIMKNEIESMAKDEIKKEITNEIRQCTIDTANPEYTVLQMKGIFGVRGYKYFNINIYFSKSNDLYWPDYATFSTGQVDWDQFVTIGENTFLVSYVYGDTGTEYLRNNEYWYNLKTRKIELNYIRDWVNGGLTLPHTRCICSHDVKGYQIFELANGAFEIEMPISMAVYFDYYSDKETEEFLDGESMDINEFVKNATQAIYYDPGKNAFYIDRSDEPTYFLGDGLSPEHISNLFRDEFIQLLQSDKTYRKELADHLLG